ncbi:MAG TPA: FAD-binding protein [Puia sp.]|jgi:xylitol oxidase|nr:FAD-binding protein [Puia sp.]
MKKRTFIRLSSALVAGCAFTPLFSWQKRERLKNWAGNIEYSTGRLYYPETTDQVRELVKKYSKLKVLGTRHCFNSIADSTENLISLKKLDQVVELDPKTLTVKVGPGITYGQLGPYLHTRGFALHNLASLPHISVAGACSTATHGSGIKNGNLATAVSEIEMITAGGDLLRLSGKKDGEQFQSAVVSLGALGVITGITLDIQPTYRVKQVVYENLPMAHLQGHFDEILSSGYSVSLFTDWQSENINEVWIKTRVAEGENLELKPEFFGAKLATKNLHPIVNLSAENCTEQMGISGPWYDRLPHFRMGFTPSSGKELQAEYFVPYHNAVEAILAVARLRNLVGPELMISEIRTIAADNLWMSPCYQQPCVTIHFTWKQDWPAVSKLLTKIEKELEPFNARPHWGKLFEMSPSKLQAQYKRLKEFQQMLKFYDPHGKYRNKFLDTNIYNG